jgi:hypothetical protein
MPEQSDENILAVLRDIRNSVRVATYRPIKVVLEEALPDAKSLVAYQMLDGTRSFNHVCAACKLSKRAVVALAARCIARGLMEVNVENRRVRLFDLNDFGLMTGHNSKVRGSGQ